MKVALFYTKNRSESSTFSIVVPQKTHSQQAMTKVKYVLVPDVK
jgi:hypothetical protein